MSTTLDRPGRRDLLLGGLGLAAAGVAWWRMPRERMQLLAKGQLDRLVPTQIGPWRLETTSGLVLPPPDQLAQILYDQQISRVYSAPSGLLVMMVMAYGSSQSGMLQIHRPEICYPAGGFRLTDTVRGALPLAPGREIPTRRFTARSDTRTEQVLYWTRVGELLPVSWALQRVAVMQANLAGFIPDGLLVRLSTITEDAAAGQDTLRQFARLMLAQVGPNGRRVLIGDGL